MTDQNSELMRLLEQRTNELETLKTTYANRRTAKEHEQIAAMAARESQLRAVQKIEKYMSENHKLKNYHLTDAANTIHMSCVRTKILPDEFMTDVNNNSTFRLSEFEKCESGNIFNFVNTKYIPMARLLVNLKCGGNGGMASIGRGEWMIVILAGTGNAVIIKNGDGDILLIEHNDKMEVKWNGGKINISECQGRDISLKCYKMICSQYNKTDQKYRDFVPFRKKNDTLFDKKELDELHAFYWRAINDGTTGSLSAIELQKMMLERALNNVFKKINTLLIVNDNGDFMKFKNKQRALEYYTKFIEEGKFNRRFEIRANKSNPPAIYMNVL